MKNYAKFIKKLLTFFIDIIIPVISYIKIACDIIVYNM